MILHYYINVSTNMMMKGKGQWCEILGHIITLSCSSFYKNYHTCCSCNQILHFRKRLFTHTFGIGIFRIRMVLFSWHNCELWTVTLFICYAATNVHVMGSTCVQCYVENYLVLLSKCTLYLWLHVKWSGSQEAASIIHSNVVCANVF